MRQFKLSIKAKFRSKLFQQKEVCLQDVRPFGTTQESRFTATAERQSDGQAIAEIRAGRGLKF